MGENFGPPVPGDALLSKRNLQLRINLAEVMKERSAEVRSATSEPLHPRRICVLRETWRLT